MTGSQYRNHREEMSMTQQELADRLRISRRKVTALEGMDTVPVTDEFALSHLVAITAIERNKARV